MEHQVLSSDGSEELQVSRDKKLYTHYPQSLKEFETELETVGSIKHRNLVSLQGYSLSPAGNLLFYDYMENGSLWDVLHGEGRLLKYST
jgi:serine/threonine protein kinase